MGELSPMMKQYFAIKEQYPNCILFYRLGDFYEMFFDDAKVASRELELTLTGRDCGQEERAPMCGVPYHSSENYIARLIAKGYKVAICEQMEDPATAKGIVKRDIVRVVTPGTVLEGSMLDDETQNNYISSVYAAQEGAGICFADISTGEVYATQLPEKDLAQNIINELGRYQPKEILLNQKLLDLPTVGDFIRQRLSASVELMDDEEFLYEGAKGKFLRQFGKTELLELGVEEGSMIVPSMGALLNYLERTQIVGMERINTISLYSESQFMKLDLSARRNLELTETMRGVLRAELMEQLTGVHDMERLMTRIVYGSANGRELRSLSAALERLPGLLTAIAQVKSGLLTSLKKEMDPLEDICQLINSAIVEEPPLSVREGGIIQPGYYEELGRRHNPAGLL